jgi:hypothetical protein
MVDECHVIAAATEIGTDWHEHAVLDVTVARTSVAR